MNEDFDLEALLASGPDLFADPTRRPDTDFDKAMRAYETALPRGYLSNSQIGTFLKCGKVYEYRYVMGIKTRSNSAMAQGSAVHAAADVLHKSMKDGAPIPLEAVKDAYADAHEKYFDPNNEVELDEDDTDLGAVKDRGMGLVTLYRKAALGQHVPLPAKGEPAKPALRPLLVINSERAIRTTIVARDAAGEPMHEPVPLVAIIDVEEPHMTRDLKVRKKLPSASEADNSLQLNLYAEVRRNEIVESGGVLPPDVPGLFDVSIDALIKPSAKLPERYIRFETQTTANSRAHAVAIATEVADDIREGRFRRTSPDAWWCSEGWCGYWHLCRGKK